MAEQQPTTSAVDGTQPTEGRSAHGNVFQYGIVASDSDEATVDPAGATISFANAELSPSTAGRTMSLASETMILSNGLSEGDNSASVYWVPRPDEATGHGIWIETSPEVKSMGISRYHLNQPHSGASIYALHFTNTKGWGFSFTDESGDTYSCPTVWNRTHYIEYYSKQPIIVKVFDKPGIEAKLNPLYWGK